VDAAATVSADGDRIALTLVNRDPVEAQEIEVVLRDGSFAEDATVTIVTAADAAAARELPDVEPAGINGEQVPAKGSTLTFTLPAQSFTLVEVALG
jgi:alpha-L-arabinofuranosidase